VTPIPGGSGINTATHLAALVRDFSGADEQEEDGETMDVTLQTAVNESDYFGTVIMAHAKENRFEMINCAKKKGASQDGNETGASTGHCLVMINEGERSFVTHLGIMESFKASDTVLHELVNCRSANPSYVNHHHHIHIAGYYNMPGFSKGNLKRRLKLIRERRRGHSHGCHLFTTTTSLVPQYDATEKWDGGLIEEVLPLVDFLILNALEAGKISGIDIDDKDCGGGINRAIVLTQLADFFFGKSPLTHVIVTLGSLGAVCLFQGEVVASMSCTKRFQMPVDPTGAGDAFAAGFLFGIMDWRQKRGHGECAEIGSLLQGSWTDAIIEGMRFGCSAGTACVTRAGASIPAPKEEIEDLLNAGNYSDEESEDDDRSGEIDDDGLGPQEESYDEDEDSDYSDSDRSYYSESDDYSSGDEDEKKEDFI